MTYATYPSLRDRVVFISGGSSGIGAELVRAFSQQGAKVAFCGTKVDGGQAVIDEVSAAGRFAPWYAACDVRDVVAYQALLKRVGNEVGPVRVLVNNAGRDDRHAMEMVTPELWDDRLALNLKHYFFAIQATAPGMAAAGAPITGVPGNVVEEPTIEVVIITAPTAGASLTERVVLPVVGALRTACIEGV